MVSNAKQIRKAAHERAKPPAGLPKPEAPLLITVDEGIHTFSFHSHSFYFTFRLLSSTSGRGFVICRHPIFNPGSRDQSRNLNQQRELTINLSVVVEVFKL